MVIGDVIFLIVLFWFCHRVNEDGKAIANAGKKEVTKRGSDGDSSFIDTAMWMSFED